MFLVEELGLGFLLGLSELGGRLAALDAVRK